MLQRCFALCLFVALVAALSCSDRDTIYECDPVPEEPEFSDSEEDSIVRANSYILKDAVEAFAMDNLSQYPRSVEEDYTYNTNEELTDYLPDRQMLWNPYTGERNEPTVGVAGAPGEIGLLPVMDGDYCAGYYITGYGQDSLIVELTDTLSTEERAVIDNCLLLREAAEDYAFDYFDEYPRTLTYPSNDLGKVFLEYLPGGERLQNPYTGGFTEPSCFYTEQPDAPGEIAYHYVYLSGFYIGYEIIGFGDDRVICRIANALYPQDFQVMANCYIVRWAVELFAVENGGFYPSNVNIDTTPLGHTVIDLLINGRLLQNPYTMACTEPIDGIACSPGQTGYKPVGTIDGIIGYLITGSGQQVGNAYLLALSRPRE